MPESLAQPGASPAPTRMASDEPMNSPRSLVDPSGGLAGSAVRARGQ
jgi:hypothetical protein